MFKKVNDIFGMNVRWGQTLAALCMLLGCLNANGGQAATMTLEQKYQDVFVSAGYGTAMGAAMGAAMLSFRDHPEDHLRYIAIGASIGFFSGTVFGTYVTVAPSFASQQPSNDKSDFSVTSLEGRRERELVVKPTFNLKGSLEGLSAGAILAKF
jgi:hypothetical protein